MENKNLPCNLAGIASCEIFRNSDVNGRNASVLSRLISPKSHLYTATVSAGKTFCTFTLHFLNKHDYLMKSCAKNKKKYLIITYTSSHPASDRHSIDSLEHRLGLIFVLNFRNNFSVVTSYF